MPPVPHLAQLPLPRLITYYQTHHDASGNFISILPLIKEPGIEITHVNVAAIHVNEDPANITLNDHHPDHERFDSLWAEMRILQASGVKVLGMLGGAAKGTFSRLDTSFERYYPPVAALVRSRSLDGLDLDVEEKMSLEGVIRLIDALRRDFGPAFLITLAPVAAALLDARRNLSGFDYKELEKRRGADITWYHAQFYCGWGDCANPLMYELILAHGWPSEKVVAGLVTSPENGHGWVPWESLGLVIPVLQAKNPRFGGVFGWEYFNSMPGGRERPWEWARWMTALLRGEKATAAAGGHVLEDVKNMAKREHEAHRRTVEADPDGPSGPDAPVPEQFDYYSDGSCGDGNA